MNRPEKESELPIKAIEKHPSEWGWQRKWDGIRCTIIGGKDIVTGDGIDEDARGNKGHSIMDQFPEIKDVVRSIPNDCMVDGELLYLSTKVATSGSLHPDGQSKGWIPVEDFNIINGRTHTTDITKIKLGALNTPATFCAFDIRKDRNGDNIEHMEIQDRMKELLFTLPYKTQANLDDRAFIAPLNFNKPTMSEMWEGVVWKRLGSEYNDSWYKQKNWLEKDFTILGYNEGTRMISTITVDSEPEPTDVTYNGKQFPQTEEVAKKLRGATAVVRYMRGKDKLRFPVLKEVRYC